MMLSHKKRDNQWVGFYLEDEKKKKEKLQLQKINDFESMSINSNRQRNQIFKKMLKVIPKLMLSKRNSFVEVNEYKNKYQSNVKRCHKKKNFNVYYEYKLTFKLSLFKLKKEIVRVHMVKKTKL